jgi:hypothetical protein
MVSMHIPSDSAHRTPGAFEDVDGDADVPGTRPSSPTAMLNSSSAMSAMMMPAISMGGFFMGLLDG